MNNPTASGETTSASTVTLTATVYDASGSVVTPSAASPLTVTVHGAPATVISPTTTTLTSGSTVTLSYSGRFFRHPLTVKASMPNGAGGQAIGTTLLLQQNQVCTFGTQSNVLNLTDTNWGANGLTIQATVGYNNPVASNFKNYTVDTGSLGVIVPRSELGPDAVGPGAAGVKYYDSSGNEFSGNYYLAPVSFRTSGGATISTTPIQVLAVDKGFCAPKARECDPSNPPNPNGIHYLGIGFNRNSTIAGDLFNSPAANAFLNLTDSNSGADTTPGYILSGANNTVTLGLASTTGYALTALTASQTVPGDWNTAPGCFGFPNAASPNQFCGTVLLDVGISNMYLDLVSTLQPSGTVITTKTSTGETISIVPNGTAMSILTGTSSSPSMSYQFTSGSTSSLLAPSGSITWIDSSQIFVNTGRRPLFGFNYLYDSQCGQVGFQAV